jgi:uncharacterized protein
MIFVDTSAFLARYLTNDQHHRAALAIWRDLERPEARLYTSSFVLDETLTLLGRRARVCRRTRGNHLRLTGAWHPAPG